MEFYGKNFLIIDTLNNFKWEIKENEFKTILNKKAYKATCVVKKNQKENIITAWFSDDIKCAFGPDLYYGLPGLILQLDTGDLTYTCQEISISNDVTFKKPNSGKKVTQKNLI
ncbi:MAG: GLPGLI family protein [Flavobacterium sp.]|nr:GLPGLI family protein [Flavobacterium sp.]